MQKRIIGLLLGFIMLGGAGCVSLSSSSGTQTTGPGGMFVSPDKGETWQAISTLLKPEGNKSLSQVSVYRLFEDPHDSNAFYWASRESGLLYTYDAGKSWQQATGALSKGFIYSVAVHPQDKCTLYVTNGVQVFMSTDCSRSWSEIYRESTSDRVVSLTIRPNSPFKIVMAKRGGDILESSDAGVSWQVLKRLNTTVVDIVADPHEDGRLFVATQSKGLYRSTDGGKTWVSLTSKMNKLTGVTEYRRLYLSPENAGTLYWISTFGILTSRDGGDTWLYFKLLTPPGSARIYGFAVNPKNEKEMYYTATINGRSTFYRSIDGGENWITKKLPSGQIPSALRVHSDKTDRVYLGFTIPPKN